jgi:hypothetical protein
MAVNPLRLSTLVSKSNCSINNGFQALRYNTIPVSSPLAFGFADVLELSYNAIKDWTVRTPITNRRELVTNPQVRQASADGEPVIDENTQGRHSHESHSPGTAEICPEYVDWDLPEVE